MIFNIAMIGVVFILGVVCAQLLAKVRELQMDTDILRTVLSADIASIKAGANSQAKDIRYLFSAREADTIKRVTSEQFLDDKIESVVELLNQEYEESIK